MRKKLLKNGDTRIVKRFAYFPIRAGDEMRWLEIVNIKQKLIVYGDIDVPYVWENIEFIDKGVK